MIMVKNVTTHRELLERLFPFHIILKKDMTLVKIGSGLEKVIGKNIVGQSFTNNFLIKLPFIRNLSFETLLKRQHKAILVEEKSKKIVFRGEFIVFEYNAPSEILELCFVGTPVLRDMEAFKQSNLKIRDFALYDALPDTLFLLQGQKKSIQETTKLSKKLLEQKALLEKKNLALEQFAYIVSHDLKAPLRSIGSLATFLEEDLADKMTEDDVENMDLLRSRVKRMENLINGILEYSRIDRIKPEKKQVDLNYIIKEIHASVEHLKDKPLTINVPQLLPTLIASDVRMQQIFQNLISNAIKYNNKDHCIITITYEKLPKGYRFTVKDNGPGIEKKYQEKIFGIFQTLQARDRFESTGVGLSIVKKIIEEEANGRIWIESKKNIFTKFIFDWLV